MSEFLDKAAKAGPPLALALALFAGAVAWGNSTAKLDTMSKTLESVGRKQDSMAADVQSIAQSLSAIQVTSQFSRESIAELKTRVRDLEVRR
jgi:outer membrane murein-binding lipoprotein Lpp